MTKRSTYIPLGREDGPSAERSSEDESMEGSFGTWEQKGLSEISLLSFHALSPLKDRISGSFGKTLRQTV